MLRLGGRSLYGLLFLLYLASFVCGQALAAENCTRVVSMVRDNGGSFLLLNTTGDAPLPPPSVRYCAQGSSELIMVYDFAGLLWNLPPQVVVPLNSPLSQVRIAQLQANPPICRIIVKSTTEAAFKDVAFRSAPGTFMITWAAHINTPAPEHTTVSDSEHTTVSAPEHTTSIPLPQSPPVPSVPILTVNGVNPLKLVFTAPQGFSYHAVRLHEPERYVVDFDSPAASEPVFIPAVNSGLPVQDIRLSCPIDTPNRLRMVLDLMSISTTLEESSGTNRLQLSVKDPSILAGSTHAIEYAGSMQKLSALKRANVLKGTTIVLDAGHGGSDPGAQRGTLQEKELTLSIVDRLYKMLTTDGARVTLTRSDDTFISIQDRVRLSLDAHPDIFLSVHINSLESNNAIHGIETYFRTDQSLPLARCIHAALVNQLEVPDRGIRNARFYVINHTPIPSVLAEVGFISNPEERADLASGDYQNKVAQALEDGVALFTQHLRDPNTPMPVQTVATKPILDDSPSNTTSSNNVPVAPRTISSSAVPINNVTKAPPPPLPISTNIAPITSNLRVSPPPTINGNAASPSPVSTNYSGRDGLGRISVPPPSSSNEVTPVSGRINSVVRSPLLLPHI